MFDLVKNVARLTVWVFISSTLLLGLYLLLSNNQKPASGLMLIAVAAALFIHHTTRGRLG
jgi:hypothetical protein